MADRNQKVCFHFYTEKVFAAAASILYNYRRRERAQFEWDRKNDVLPTHVACGHAGINFISIPLNR